MIKEALITDISEVSKRILSINIKNGRCTAHLYHLERQGDSEKSRFIYRCLRAGCHHYATLTNVSNRVAQCRNCGNTFSINIDLHIIMNPRGGDIEDMFFEFPSCCDGAKELIVPEVESLDFLEE